MKKKVVSQYEKEVDKFCGNRRKILKTRIAKWYDGSWGSDIWRSDGEHSTCYNGLDREDTDFLLDYSNVLFPYGETDLGLVLVFYTRKRIIVKGKEEQEIKRIRISLDNCSKEERDLVYYDVIKPLVVLERQKGDEPKELKRILMARWNRKMVLVDELMCVEAKLKEKNDIA